MERNWLIRTSQTNQILGPVSKEKIIELISSNALSFDDEVMSGNGYWFSIKEKDLVDKYIFGDIPQSYNPISDAKSRLKKLQDEKKDPALTRSISLDLTSHDSSDPVEKQSGVEKIVHLPKSDDLEFPSVVTAAHDNTTYVAPIVVSIHSPEKKKEISPKMDLKIHEDVQLPKSEDLDYPTLVNKQIVSPPPPPPPPPLPLSLSDSTVSKNNNEIELRKRKLKKDSTTALLEEDLSPKITLPKTQPDLPSIDTEILRKKSGVSVLFILVFLMIAFLLGIWVYYYMAILNKSFF